MTAVTVDLADLERIVFAAGVIKTIEGAIASHKRDPFVQPHLDFTEAHNRLATAMRNASRAEAGTLVNFEDPLTKEEANALTYVKKACDGDDRNPGLPFFTISVPDKAEAGRAMSVYDQLQAKGCVKVGQWITGVVWPGEVSPSISADPDRGYAAVITQRGRTRLTEWQAQQVNATTKKLGA